MATYTGSIGNSETSIFQSPRTSDNPPGSQEYPWLLPPASGLISMPLSSVTGPCEPMPGFIPRGSLVNGSVRDHLSTRDIQTRVRIPKGLEREQSLILGKFKWKCYHSKPIRRPLNTGSRTRETRMTKVVKVFACLHDSCPFEASSRKDIRRHLKSDKHRKDYVDGSPPGDRFYCEIPQCRFADEGFSRRDNMIRHMSTMHDVEINREKAGRKRSHDEQDGESASARNTPL